MQYVHICYGHDTKFFERTIRMINDPNLGFTSEDHLFITPFDEVYSQLSRYSNVFCDKRSFLYYRYYSKAKCIISHGLAPALECVLTPRYILRRVIYRYWGGSRTTHISLNIKQPVQFITDGLKIILFRRVLKSFAAIGIANIADIIDLSSIIPKDVKYYQLNYLDNNYCQIAQEIINNSNFDSSGIDNRINVLLGHRGTIEGNHIDIIKRLSNYKQYDLSIYIPLSYGDKGYINEVLGYIEETPSLTIHTINEFLPYKAYLEFLSDMDICIFDGETSYALGNISILIAMKKKLYLSRDGVIAKAFEAEGLPYFDVKTIGVTSFDSFVEKANYSETALKSSTLSYQDIDMVINNWKILFNDYS